MPIFRSSCRATFAQPARSWHWPVLGLALIVAASPAGASSFTVIYNYSSAADNGPEGGLTAGPDGTLYSATAGGGPAGAGAIFKLVKPHSGTGLWSRPLLHTFLNKTDGEEPLSPPVMAPSGLLYGTTTFSGAHGYGLVYQVDPSVGAKSYKVIYSFTGGLDGGFPWGSAAIDKHGAVYATATMEGKDSAGTVIKLTPPATGQAAWTETTIHSFTGVSDGNQPAAEVLVDAAGVVYGTTYQGGSYGAGVAFMLSPPAKGKSAWSYHHLHTFTGSADGGSLDSGLIADKNGVLYGTASSGGAGGGTVYSLTPPAAPTSASWHFKVLHSFPLETATDGCRPVGDVVLDAKGALYGTTTCGGSSYDGTLFKLTPPPAGHSTWTRRIIHSFGGDLVYSDSPEGSLAIGPDGAVYGSTSEGGTLDGGTVFRYAP